ncbi:GntR family transcriptional regulator [Meridianimarinicoccus roseus]|jgi:DNA-binding GntR family transcriptional regulator|uniref:GntR family transcriptional regulator n=2 Tax=Meridianimarinicoccus roseus TaxID=2072018 RepID=A0A2V2L715_9RHOB|nr:GntR family transcriptional regulator [Meridianimarinicoccus roseus]
MTGRAQAAATTPILSEQARDMIRRDIIGAALLPGDKLQLESISERYGIGVNPVREALNQLVSEGWVDRRSQRGFFVKGMSLADLESLVKTRIWLETKALSESMLHATEAWEEALVLSYHRLARTQRLIEREGEETLNTDWEDRHTAFHMSLLSECGSPWLLEFCATMMDQSVRYRNLSVNFNRARRGDAIAEHEQILNAVLDRDPAAATGLLERHYAETLEGLKAFLAADKAGEAFGI